MDRTKKEAAQRKEVRWIGLDRGAPDELGGVLEQERHSEGCDQDREQRPPEKWLVRELKDAEVHDRRSDHRDDECDDEGEIDRQVLKAKRNEQRPTEEGAHHGEVSLGEVDEADDSIDDCVAKRDKGIERADGETDDCVLEKLPHALRHLLVGQARRLRASPRL